MLSPSVKSDVIAKLLQRFVASFCVWSSIIVRLTLFNLIQILIVLYQLRSAPPADSKETLSDVFFSLWETGRELLVRFFNRIIKIKWGHFFFFFFKLKVVLKASIEKVWKHIKRRENEREGWALPWWLSIEKLLPPHPPAFWKLIELTGGQRSRMLRTLSPSPWLVARSPLHFSFIWIINAALPRPLARRRCQNGRRFF